MQIRTSCLGQVGFVIFPGSSAPPLSYRLVHGEVKINIEEEEEEGPLLNETSCIGVNSPMGHNMHKQGLTVI